MGATVPAGPLHMDSSGYSTKAVGKSSSMISFKRFMDVSYSISESISTHFLIIIWRAIRKNHFNFSLPNSFSISSGRFRETFSFFIFGWQKIRNKRWSYLNNQLKNPLKGIFSLKSLLLRKYISRVF